MLLQLLHGNILKQKDRLRRFIQQVGTRTSFYISIANKSLTKFEEHTEYQSYSCLQSFSCTHLSDTLSLKHNICIYLFVLFMQYIDYAFS